MEQDFLSFKKERSLPSTSHKEERRGRITSDHEDRKNMQKVLWMGIHPFSELECPDDIVNIYACQVSSDKVYVDHCISIGKDQMKSFYESLLYGF